MVWKEGLGLDAPYLPSLPKSTYCEKGHREGPGGLAASGGRTYCCTLRVNLDVCCTVPEVAVTVMLKLEVVGVGVGA